MMKFTTYIFAVVFVFSAIACKDEKKKDDAWEAEKARGDKSVKDMPGESYLR